MPVKPKDNHATRNELRIALRLAMNAKQRQSKDEGAEPAPRLPEKSKSLSNSSGTTEKRGNSPLDERAAPVESDKTKEKSDFDRYEKLKYEALDISQNEMNDLRYTAIPNAKLALQKARLRLQNVRDNAPISITLPTWFRQVRKITPAGLGLEIGGIMGNVIVGKKNQERELSHKEQVSLWEAHVEKLQEKVVELEAKDRQLVDRLDQINQEVEGLRVRQRQ